MSETFHMEMNEKIRKLAEDRFDKVLIEEFINIFNGLVVKSTVVDSILQISTDEGDELEIGFFTESTISDVTLSNGKVYSYSYPVDKVQSINFLDKGSKCVLTIIGEKKFDYNVVKPNPIDNLKNYEAKLRVYLANTFKQ